MPKIVAAAAAAQRREPRYYDPNAKARNPGMVALAVILVMVTLIVCAALAAVYMCKVLRYVHYWNEKRNHEKWLKRVEEDRERKRREARCSVVKKVTIVTPSEQGAAAGEVEMVRIVDTGERVEGVEPAQGR
ncbi:hypothetical protein DFH27DRAFT_603559 [Peziza echinospora]|nr:hypothetical protein DFH27DRAFT_603559 [Peziza echinospora]